MKNYLLEKTGLTWNFKSETELENFIWFNLAELFDLIPLKRQYYVEGLYCDIIATTQDKQLVILELKITPDRYIVQQLTRYFHYFQQTQQLQNIINYNLPVKLVALVPGVHSDNLIDIQYHRLDFDFYEYTIDVREKHFYFKCVNCLNHRELLSLEIITPKEDEVADFPPIPNKLKQILNKSNDSDYQGIIATRNQILSFDRRIKETVTASQIIYSFNKSNPVAEIRYDNSRKQPILFLWLPLTNCNCHTITVRMRVWTDWHKVFDVGYIRKGNGNMISVGEYYSLPIALIPAKILPFTKYRARSRKFDPDNLFPEDKQVYQKFIDDPIYRQHIMRINIAEYAIKNDWTINKHGFPLATPIQNYFDVIRTIYEKQEEREINSQYSRMAQLKISPNIKKYNKDEYLLSELIDFALQERFLKLQ